MPPSRKAGGGEYLDNFVFRPTPGHTVGHMSIGLASGGEEAMFLGDVVFHPMQVYRPDWNTVYCEFGDRARASRRWALEHAAENDVLLFLTHPCESSAGRVGREGGGFSWRYE